MAADEWSGLVFSVAMWYLTSFGTLLLNKYLMSTVHVQPNLLAAIQMSSATLYGGLTTLIKQQLQESPTVPHDSAAPSTLDLEEQKTPAGRPLRRRIWQMSFVGLMRFATVVLGLVSLNHVAASFTETIKASAPFFTVIIAYFMLGEATTVPVLISLVPVASGLVMVSFTELSFNLVGFLAAVSTNVIECVQNVFSKRLLAKDFTASQLQFYTSVTALLLQAPIFLWNQYALAPSPGPSPGGGGGGLAGLNATEFAGSDLELVTPPPFVYTRHLVGLLWIDGVLYHMQSVVAYVVMSYLSPVTVSVVNTFKRAMLICISVMVFGNRVTPIAKLGTMICLAGVVWYNIAKQSAAGTPVARQFLHSWLKSRG